MSRPKGSAVLWAAWRSGLKDLQGVALNPLPGQTMQTVSEPGSIANPTVIEVQEEKHPKASRGPAGPSEPAPEPEIGMEG